MVPPYRVPYSGISFEVQCLGRSLNNFGQVVLTHMCCLSEREQYSSLVLAKD